MLDYYPHPYYCFKLPLFLSVRPRRPLHVIRTTANYMDTGITSLLTNDPAIVFSRLLEVHLYAGCCVRHPYMLQRCHRLIG